MALLHQTANLPYAPTNSRYPAPIGFVFRYACDEAIGLSEILLGATPMILRINAESSSETRE